MLSDIVIAILRIGVFIGGVALVLWTISQALRSFVLPRADRSFLTNTTFRVVYMLFAKRFNANTPFARRDQILAMLSPVAMFLLPLVWLTLITVGYAAMYWALNPDLGLREALILSGSSLMTLGFAFQDTLPMILLAFSQAALGMMLVALLIGYLPTMYSAFSQRESMVTKMEAYAGSPPEPAELIRRMDYIQMLNKPEDMRVFWQDWQDWFVLIEENHTTLAPMNFFRSPKPDRHWVIAAGAVLDAAAIIASSVDVDRARQSGLAIRAGFLALRSIADYFEIEYDPEPQPGDPISVTQEEFEAVLDKLAAFGIPLHPDRAECWDHFAGWRVNYDEVLLRLAWITAAPYGYWSSDRVREWLPADIPPPEESALSRIRGTRRDEQHEEDVKPTT